MVNLRLCKTVGLSFPQVWNFLTLTKTLILQVTSLQNKHKTAGLWNLVELLLYFHFFYGPLAITVLCFMLYEDNLHQDGTNLIYSAFLFSLSWNRIAEVLRIPLSLPLKSTLDVFQLRQVVKINKKKRQRENSRKRKRALTEWEYQENAKVSENQA